MTSDRNGCITDGELDVVRVAVEVERVKNKKRGLYTEPLWDTLRKESPNLPVVMAIWPRQGTVYGSSGQEEDERVCESTGKSHTAKMNQPCVVY